MFQPLLKSSKKSKPIVTNSFGGLNRREAIGDNEFSDMYSVSGRRFPYISSSDKKNVCISDPALKNITKLISPQYQTDYLVKTNFCGVNNGAFYFNGESRFILKSKQDVMPPFNDESLYPFINSSISLFNGRFFFFPDNRLFNPLKPQLSDKKADFGLLFTKNVIIKNSYSSTTKNYTIYIYCADYLNIKEGKSGTSLFLCDESQSIFEGDSITFNYSFTDGQSKQCYLCIYDDANPYLRTELFKNCNSTENFSTINYPVKCVVDKILTNEKTDDTTGDTTIRAYGLVVSLYDVNGFKTIFNLGNDSNGSSRTQASFDDFSIYNVIPSLAHTCEYNGRLFGLDYYGGYIYASKLGDASVWSDYDTEADASWYTEIPTDGKWTGICSFNSYLYCFKEDLIYVLYGDSPSNFSIIKTISHGCIDGDSITVFGNAIYYLAHDGFYMMNSYQPVKISENLNRKYTGAVCCGFDGILYCSCTYDGGKELLTYDTEKNLWFKDENLDIVSFCVHNNKLYGATNDKVYVFGDGSYPDEWYVVSKKFDDSSSALRSLCTLLFRLNIPGGSDACVYISYDGGEWIKCGDVIRGKLTNFDNSKYSLDGIDEETLHKASESYYQKFPVRFRCASSYQFKLVCHGDVTLESLERTVSINGSYQR